MGFVSFLGRVIFASVFILSAWQMFNEFGEDGGPAAKEFTPKLTVVKDFVVRITGRGDLSIDARIFTAVCIFLKGFGGLLFVIGSNVGAYILMGYLILTTPLLHDFFNYDFGDAEFLRVMSEFLQCVALLGALLFFIGMKNSIVRKQARKKSSKHNKTA